MLHHGRASEAINELKKALEIYPDLHNAHNDLGLALMESNQLDAAVEEFKKAIEIDPGNNVPHRNLSVTFYKKKQFSLAVTEAKTAYSLAPENPDIVKNLLLILQHQGAEFYRVGNRAGLIQILQEMLALDPNNVGFRDDLAILTRK